MSFIFKFMLFLSINLGFSLVNNTIKADIIKSSCLKSLDEGESISINSYRTLTCKKQQIEVYRSLYEVEKRNNKYKVKIPLLFLFDFDLLSHWMAYSTFHQKKYTKAINQVNSCLQNIKSLWAKKGFQLEFDFTLNEMTSLNAEKNRHIVNFSSGEGRSTSRNIFMDGDDLYSSFQQCQNSCEKLDNECFISCKKQKHRNFCFILAHESMHWLGLPDEYEGSCSYQKNKPLNSQSKNEGINLMMGAQELEKLSSDKSLFDQVVLRPYQIEQIFSPICQPKKEQHLTRIPPR